MADQNYGLQTLADMIRTKWPGSYDDIPDEQLITMWRAKHGDKFPNEVQPRGVAEGAQRIEPTGGFLERTWQGLTNPRNAPTVLGSAAAIGAGIGSGGLGFIPATIAAFLAGGGGGAVGDVTRQAAESPSVFDSYDPSSTAKEFVNQGTQAALGNVTGHGMKKVGSAMYQSGAGLGRNNIMQNFRTSLPEGLEGGRGTVPVFTARGAERVGRRLAAEKADKLATAPGSGTVVDILRQPGGVHKEIAAIRSGAADPQGELADLGKFIKEFYAGQSTRPTPQYGPLGNVVGQTPGAPISRSWADMDKLRAGLMQRGQDALKAGNAGNFTKAVEGRGMRGVANQTRSLIEDNVPGIRELNLRIQGNMGLGTSLNPSRRLPEQLIMEGMDPAAAEVATTAPTSAGRIGADLAGGALAGYYSGSPWVGLGTAALMHGATAPLTRRVVGGGLYTAGRMTPNAFNLGRAGIEAQSDEDALTQDALRRAFGGIKF